MNNEQMILKHKLSQQAQRTFSEKLEIDGESKHFSAGYLMGVNEGIAAAAKACVGLCVINGDYDSAKAIKCEFGIE